MKSIKPYRILLLAILVLVIAIKVIVPFVVKNHINKLLEANENYMGKVEHVGVSFFGTTWIIENLNLETFDEPKRLQLHLSSLTIEGVDLYKALFKNEFHMKSLEIVNPNLRMIGISKTSNSSEHYKLPFTKITASSLKINNGEFLKSTNELDTIAKFSLQKLVGKDILIDEDQDFSFNSSEQLTRLVVENFYLKLNEFENLRSTKILLNESTCSINQLGIKTNYSKDKLSSKLSTERDYFDFSIKKLELEKAIFSLIKNKPQLSISNSLLKGFYLEVYRDKLLPDDITHKNYYGEMLRSIPFKIDVDSILLSNGNLVYSEKIHPSIVPSKLVFDTLEGTITNLSNHKNLEIETKLRAKLMGNAPISLNYRIKPLNNLDAFFISGHVKDFDAEQVDAFLRTSMQATAQGRVDQMYFTFSGDKNGATGDMKMKYENFELKILQKDLLKINKVLSFLGNLLVNDGSDSDSQGYRYGEIKTNPDRTKSFPNYVWTCIRDGIIQIIAGKGKKKK